MEPTIRYRIQIVLCASAKIALNNGISNRLTNIARFFEVGGQLRPFPRSTSGKQK